jgi:proteasome accessory factor B
MSRIERLVNLITVLSGAPVPVSYERIVREVPGYEGRPESVRRQFERDKATLRDMGIDLRTGSTDAVATSGDAVGYLIPADVTIADPGLSVPERAALAAATALVWGTDETTAQDASPGLVDPVPALADTLLAAIEARRVLTFTYRSASAGADGARVRTVEPWRLVHQAGRWYLIGRDVEAADRRTFRLDRVVGDVRAGGTGGFARPVDDAEDRSVPVRGWEIGAGPSDVVHVAVRPDREWWFLRETGGRPDATGADGALPDWPRVAVDVRDLDAFARFVLASLDSVVVVGPEAARAAVRGQLDRLASVARAEVPS